ncbi:MAG TPA: flagellar basal body rod C-terminal domain-containing protein [Nitrospinaceae bacterium]|nr:flagellar basal body rod C-terminal domain-containing protein [Nitrospinaceae bacterium]
MSPRGNNLFTESNGLGTSVVGNPGAGGNGTILSGSLEMSNVDIAEEMVSQITAKAAFTANARVIRAADEMIGTLLDIKS